MELEDTSSLLIFILVFVTVYVIVCICERNLNSLSSREMKLLDTISHLEDRLYKLESLHVGV